MTVVVEGLPAGLAVDLEQIHLEMRRRMGGYGRGGRMKIETDRVEILGGVRFSRTLGSPVSLVIRNLDHSNWAEAMNPQGDHPGAETARAVSRPRPGHADLAGALKFDTHDARNVFERSSARETAARTAAGALAKSLLRPAGIDVTSHTLGVGSARGPELAEDAFDALLALPEDAPMRTVDPAAAQAMIQAVEQARRNNDSVGGQFEVLARGLPAGLGSHTHWDRRLDGRLGGAMLSIQAVKAVSIGEGVESAERHGSRQHDEIQYDRRRRGFVRPTNRAGGIEGGMSNGEMLRLRCYLKPLATLPRPLRSVDLDTKQPFDAIRERSDTIPIVAAGVVGEAMAALVLADEMLIKFGGDSIGEMLRNLDAYREGLKRF